MCVVAVVFGRVWWRVLWHPSQELLGEMLTRPENAKSLMRFIGAGDMNYKVVVRKKRADSLNLSS